MEAIQRAEQIVEEAINATGKEKNKLLELSLKGKDLEMLPTALMQSLTALRV